MPKLFEFRSAFRLRRSGRLALPLDIQVDASGLATVQMGGRQWRVVVSEDGREQFIFAPVARGKRSVPEYASVPVSSEL